MWLDFHLGPSLKVLVAHLFLVLDVCNVKPSYRKSWARILDVRLDLWPLLQGQTRVARIKCAYNSLILSPSGLQWEVMGGGSSDMVRFDFGPLIGQTRIAKPKSTHNSLIIGPRGLQCETNS